MLKTLVEAKIPLVHMTTRDHINADYLVKTLVGLDDQTYMVEESAITDKTIYTAMGNGVSLIRLKNPTECNWSAAYLKLKKHKMTCLVINDEVPQDYFFSAGVLEPTREIITQQIVNLIDSEHINQVLNIVNGLTLKEISECLSLAYREGPLTPDSIAKYRIYFGQMAKGVFSVNVGDDFYKPLKSLEDYAHTNKKAFVEAKEMEMIPKGLILYGPPGTGKTQASKYLARELEVPLYRMDMGSMMNKWHGESELNLRNALAFVDREAPCILLLDEVEKVFTTGPNEDASSSRMLGNLLWWLQEKTSRVLVVMTTNDIEAIPPELYRAGRIDVALELPALDGKAIGTFLKAYREDYAKRRPHLKLPEVAWMVTHFEDGATPAECEELFLTQTKKLNYCN